MSDRLRPVSIDRLARLLDDGLSGASGAVLGLGRELVFAPGPRDPFRLPVPGGLLDTPVGVAAGPHTQMSQNIVAAWLMGARTIELKTVQSRDTINVTKPCIAVQDQGFNCEWSQELPLEESLRQYADAWLLVHLLAVRLGHPATHPGTAFVMSVGYDLAGILSPNVQGFLDGMTEASSRLEDAARAASSAFPEARRLAVPPCICGAVTLSTMHGCPPREIERIGQYLIEERGLDTLIKLNPTLLGADEVRSVLRARGCEAQVPDEAFEHDLRYEQALRLVETLRSCAGRRRVRFGLKLTNTLETVNGRGLLPASEARLYMSGPPLLPLGVRLAARLRRDLGVGLDISFSAGADCRSVPDLLACGLAPITVCTDLLRPGGYGRLRQYLDELRLRMGDAGATSLREWVVRAQGSHADARAAALANLEAYAARLGEAPVSTPAPSAGVHGRFKGVRALSAFDCVRAPCEETCPAEQRVADYMHHAARGDWPAALAVVLSTNPLPRITGTVCDALCQPRCTRSLYDDPLRIRDVKRFASLARVAGAPARPGTAPSPGGPAVAVVGAGPSGLACAAALALEGVRVDVFDAASRPGGLARRVIPCFRLSDDDIDVDVDGVLALGVCIHSSTTVDRGLFERLRAEYAAVYVAVGAQRDRRLGVPGEDAPGVLPALDLLERSRAGTIERIGPRVAVIGGGNSAVDAARVALRLAGSDGRVTIVYRRTLREMPADHEELAAALAEGAVIRELAAPTRIREAGGALDIVLQPMELGPVGDDGRRSVVPASLPPAVERFDTVITAIGQEPVLDFVAAAPAVLVGGDAARGPASIILAVADGRRAAGAILAALGRRPSRARDPRPAKYTSVAAQLSRASRRVWRCEDPAAEAARCLACDEVCNLCVTVCPNRANLFWESAARSYRVQSAVRAGDGSVRIEEQAAWRATQRVQVFNVADWCNECGNCTTFCPTAGSPYRDKPRLCLTDESFADEDNAFRLVAARGSGGMGIRMRSGGDEARLAAGDGAWVYEAPGVNAVLDKETLAINRIALTRPRWDTAQAAAMACLAADLGATPLGRWLAEG